MLLINYSKLMLHVAHWQAGLASEGQAVTPANCSQPELTSGNCQPISFGINFQFALISHLCSICTCVGSHQKRFAPKAFCTKSILHQKCFAPKAFRTKSVLHQKRFAQKAFCTCVILHQKRFAPKAFRTKSVSHQKRFAPKAFHTKSVLH